MTPLDRVREIALALPEAHEKAGHGRPTFHIRKGKSFVMFMDNHHNDGRLAIWCNADGGAQDVLVRSRPDRFFVPPYVGHRGWVGVRLEGEVDWGEVAMIIEDAWRAAAPRRLLASLDQAT
ncbi:MAG: MmcQ/YjbR family DNA-binding protein [Dehalococcoidia bacterium]